MNGKRILIVDDEAKHRKLYSETLEDAGFEIYMSSSGEDACRALETHSPDMLISDVRMPGMDGITLLKKVREQFQELPALLITAFPEIKDAVIALKLGAVDYLEKPIDLDELIAAVNDALGLSCELVIPDVPQEMKKGIVAESPAMSTILRDAFRVAKSDATVLITGESGSGKEVLANFIHRCSRRSDRQFVALNCAAIPTNLLASELFGHVKGAFTGANSNRNGIFKEADGGTLLLDEIGEMPLELQASMLRAIETGKISPVGTDREIEVDFRLITATNRDLYREMENGTFREDLYYRLNVIAFEMPPLRERPEDIMPLARLFLAAGQKKKNLKRFSPATAKTILNYPWPGNVRELANAMERAAILANREVILPEHLPPNILRKQHEESSTAEKNHTVKTIQQAEFEAIRSALERTGGNRTKAAEILGISRRAMIYKIKRFNLH